MFLQSRTSHDMVEVLSLNELFDPCIASITGRYHAGEEVQDSAQFAKIDLEFPSGEALPACWIDAEYRSGRA